MIIVRAAKLSDLENIVTTHSLSAMETYDRFLSPSTLEATFSPKKLRHNWEISFKERCLNPENRLLLVAEDSEHPEWGILGIGRCHIITNPHERSSFDRIMGNNKTTDTLSEIQTLYVHPQYQKHGVGKALLGQMARFLSERGNQKSIVITLDGYEDSAHFYQRVGGCRLVGQFMQNTAETAGAADDGAAPSKFNLWLFDNISNCFLPQKGIQWVGSHPMGRAVTTSKTNDGNERTA